MAHDGIDCSRLLNIMKHPYINDDDSRKIWVLNKEDYMVLNNNFIMEKVCETFQVDIDNGRDHHLWSNTSQLMNDYENLDIKLKNDFWCDMTQLVIKEMTGMLDNIFLFYKEQPIYMDEIFIYLLNQYEDFIQEVRDDEEC